MKCPECNNKLHEYKQGPIRGCSKCSYVVYARPAPVPDSPVVVDAEACSNCGAFDGCEEPCVDEQLADCDMWEPKAAAPTVEPDRISVMIVRGVEGESLYINHCRVFGPKPWGGGKQMVKFSVERKEIIRALEAQHGA